MFLTLFSGFVHFYVDFMAFWSLKPALRAFRGTLEGLYKQGRLTIVPTATKGDAASDAGEDWPAAD